MLYEAQEKVIELFDDYSTIWSNAKYESLHEKWLKTLTPKQLFQRLPTKLAQTKVSNTSENLLNQICQIIYYLCRAKCNSKKLYNNIMNSIKL